MSEQGTGSVRGDQRGLDLEPLEVEDTRVRDSWPVRFKRLGQEGEPDAVIELLIPAERFEPFAVLEAFERCQVERRARQK